LDAAAPAELWPSLRRLGFRFAFIYFGIYIVTTQMFWGGLAPMAEWEPLNMLPPFRQAITWVARHLLGITEPLVIEGSGSGDKVFDWAHVCLLLGIAVFGTAIWTLFDRKRVSYSVVEDWFRLAVRLALGTTMLSYGVSKAVPLQMGYGPSLTRLVEPFGNFSPMGVLWASMGSSPAYQSFTGCTEILGGVLLLLPQTALLGALVSLGVATQIFVLNMTYDVPVKLFSFHLILLALLLILPERIRLRNFFLLNRATNPAGASVPRSRRKSRLILAAQVCFAIYVTTAMAYGAKEGWTAYGGGAPKSLLYGIWEVEQMSVDEQSRPPLLLDDQRWRRLIFDRGNRAVFQGMNDSLATFNAKIDPGKKTIDLTKNDDPNWKATLAYDRPANGRLMLSGDMDGHRVGMELRALDRETFLLVNRGFHWVQERPFNR
jgi:hypothetical protein